VDISRFVLNINNGLFPRLQSAYRANHSTETDVLKVLSDILLSIDDGNLSALALLDLSADFDTVDHDILLRRLDISYRLGGTVLVPISLVDANEFELVLPSQRHLYLLNCIQTTFVDVRRRPIMFKMELDTD